MIDPRLRAAVDTSIGWYEDLCALHGVASELSDGLWRSLSAPPPLHSDAVVVEPGVGAELVLDRLGERAHAGVKDSFATLDLSGGGMGELFSATWLHRPADRGHRPGTATAWVRVRTPQALAQWTAHHDTGEVLLPGLLHRAAFAVLARPVDGRLAAGAVAHLDGGAVSVSNVHAPGGHALDWAELAAAVGAVFPGRPLVGYERGADLEAALAGGFEPVGDLRVWTR